MINPPMSSLLEKVDSRYTLAILTAKGLGCLLMELQN